ncbi:MAG: hypothetical protein ACRD1G_17425, partial [Acidimicrobiales bacterium]
RCESGGTHQGLSGQTGRQTMTAFRRTERAILYPAGMIPTGLLAGKETQTNVPGAPVDNRQD